jgi:hypothetical protein
MVVFAMTEIPWDELIAVTARIEKLSDDRFTARYIGNEELRENFQAQIDDLLKRRKRLIERLSNCVAAH